VTVTPASLMISENATTTYGTAPSSVTVEYVGFVNEDTAADLTTQPTCPLPSFLNLGVGTWPNTVHCSGAASPNYSISYANGTYTVLRAPLTITASSHSTTYGAAPIATTASYSGFKNGETAAVLTQQPVCGNPVVPTSPVGTYTSTCHGATAANYDISYVDGVVTVNKAPLTITAADSTAPYGAVPTVTPSYSGFVNGENSSVLLTPPVCTSNTTVTTSAGVYPARSTCSGATATNYDISFVAGKVTITKAPLTVRADDKSRYYGEANPVFTYTVTGFVNGETASVITGTPALSTPATATSAPGPYPISVNVSGMSATNYSFTGQAGTLTVTKAPTMLVASDTSTVRSLLTFAITYRAKLTHGTTGAPIAGASVEFHSVTLLGRTMSCIGTTDNQGVATCTLVFPLNLLPSIPPFYDANYAGSVNYLPASDRANIRIL
jgi:hypothetical protein